MFTPPPIPKDEARRLAALMECQVLDTEGEPAFDAFVDAAAEVCETPIALISLLDGQRQWFKANRGLAATHTDRELSFCGHIVFNGEAMTVPDTHADERFARHPLVVGQPHIRFYAGVPLALSTGERLGSLCVIDREPRTLSADQHRRLGVLAMQAAAMLELRRKLWQLEQSRAEGERLIADLRESQTAAASAEVTIFSLARLAESRDFETGAHLERVRSYCRVLAEHLRQTEKYRNTIDDEYVRLLYQTSPLHDIGKVAIPDCILLKPGRLTEEEFAIMENHALAGAQTLEAAIEQYPHAAFLRMARDIALTHHEKHDGRGYPHGRAGTDIPLCGRIVALADVYDALTSKRVYKGAYNHAIARKIILDDIGRHFDPDVVEAFVACEDRFVAIRALNDPATSPLTAAA